MVAMSVPAAARAMQSRLELLRARLREDAHLAVWVQLWTQAWLNGYAAGRADGERRIERSYYELKERAGRALAAENEAASLRLMEATAILDRAESDLTSAIEMAGPQAFVVDSRA